MIDQWPSPAKLNLFLYITGRRPDGYHNLQTLFQFLDYGDNLTFSVNNSGIIDLKRPIVGVANKDNLVIKAAHMLRDFAVTKGTISPRCGAIIDLDKHLPMGGGLGGGSSNAATTLVALNHLWHARCSEDQLADLGRSLGADVPVFVRGHAAFAEGIGDKLTPVSVAEKWYLVAHPNISVATPVVFNDPDLPRNSPIRSIETLLNCEFANDCEVIVRNRFSEVDALLSWLLEYAPSRLTGTGACVFAEFDTESAARQVLKQAPEWLHGFVARGVNRSPLHIAISGSAE